MILVVPPRGSLEQKGQPSISLLHVLAHVSPLQAAPSMRGFVGGGSCCVAELVLRDESFLLLSRCSSHRRFW